MALRAATEHVPAAAALLWQHMWPLVNVTAHVAPLMLLPRERLSSFKGRLMHHGSYGSLLHGGSSGGGLHVPAAACDDHGAVTAARALVNAVWRLWQVGVQLPEPEACKVAQSGGKVQRSVNGKSRKELHLAGGSTDGNGDRIGTAVCEELGAAGATAAVRAGWMPVQHCMYSTALKCYLCCPVAWPMHAAVRQCS